MLDNGSEFTAHAVRDWLERVLALWGRGPSFVLLRLYAPRSASEYARMTRAEDGHVGPLFRQWIVSINVALVLAVVSMILLWA